MGLAVLPARLKNELSTVAQYIVEGKDLRSDPVTEKHAAWVENFINECNITSDNVDDVLRMQVGKSFKKVLEHAGVYKRTPQGKAAFMRFIQSV